MKKVFAFAAALTACAAFFAAGSASAATAFTLVPGSYSDTGFSSWTLGSRFIANTNLTVTALGNYFPANPDDNTGEVGLWTDSGTLLASVSLTNSNSGGFTFASIPSVQLAAGQIYRVGGTTRGNLYACCGTNIFTTAPELTYLEHVEVNGFNLQFPSNSFTSFKDFGGNFQFTTEVPEPASWGMMMLGLGAAGFAMRRRQRT